MKKNISGKYQKPASDHFYYLIESGNSSVFRQANGNEDEKQFDPHPDHHSQQPDIRNQKSPDLWRFLQRPTGYDQEDWLHFHRSHLSHDNDHSVL